MISSKYTQLMLVLHFTIKQTNKKQRKQQPLNISYQSSIKIKILNLAYWPAGFIAHLAHLLPLHHPLFGSQSYCLSLGLQHAMLHSTVGLLHILFSLTDVPFITSFLLQGKLLFLVQTSVQTYIPQGNLL